MIDLIGDDQDNPIKISTGKNSLESYRFTETNTNSGIFTAEIILTGFVHDADGDEDVDTTPRTIGTGPTSGFLEVDRNSGITISFEFADGLVLTEYVSVIWNLGTVKFLKDVFSSDDLVVIRVIDPVMNLNTESLDHVLLEISLDYDVAGIVDAIETSEAPALSLPPYICLKLYLLAKIGSIPLLEITYLLNTMITHYRKHSLFLIIWKLRLLLKLIHQFLLLIDSKTSHFFV